MRYYFVFSQKLLQLACFVVSKYAVFIWILIIWNPYNMDSNAWCKLDISIYNITEDHSVAVSKTKNDHI